MWADLPLVVVLHRDLRQHLYNGKGWKVADSGFIYEWKAMRVPGCCWLRLIVLLLFPGGVGVGRPILEAQEWARFRGVNGSGLSTAASLPIRWSESENLAWKLDLAGEGSSSPVLWEDRIFLTCSRMPADRGAVPQRSLLCVDAVSGSLQWSVEAPEPVREDPPQGYLTEHGYASNSVATDGRAVYAFFGKSGVVACGFDGRVLWQVNVHRDDGRVIWKAEAAALELAYGTLGQLKYDDGRTELILAVPGEVWGLNARTGKLAWFAETQLTGNVCPSPLIVGSEIFVFGGFRSSGSYCLRSGGKGDVSQSCVKWQTRSSSYVATPVHFRGRLYWADDQGIAWCLNADTGETVYRERIPRLRTGGRPIYASPIVAGGRIYIPTRRDGTLVIPAEDSFSVLAMNRIAGDDTDFNATPAVHGNRLILRSNRALYAVGGGSP